MISPLLMVIIEASLFAIGAGLIYGIFGGGSGLFLMPGFYFLLRHFPMAQGQEMQVAVATTAATSGILGLLPTRIQLREGNVDKELLKRLFLGLSIGTILAVILLNVVPSAFLKHFFGFIVVIVALWFWFYNQAKDKRIWKLSQLLNYAFTFLIALLWFLLGVGIFLVPYLHKCGFDIRRSVGTTTFVSTVLSSLAGLLMMLIGIFRLGVSASHIGFVNMVLLLVSIIPSVIAAYFGAKASIVLPQRYLKKIYATLVLIIGVLMLVG